MPRVTRKAIYSFLFSALLAVPALAEIGSAGPVGPGTSAAPSAVTTPANATIDAATVTGGTAGEAGAAQGRESLDAGLPSSAESFFNAEAAQVAEGDVSRRKVAPVSLQLRQFGYDFFRSGGFRPDQQALVGPDYVIGPGDSLRIDVWGNIEGNYSVTVDRNGEITLPKVGVINLWGQNFEQARETIRKQIRKYFKDFELNVTMGGLRSIQIFLVGEVKSPGAYQVSSLSTILTALSQAGGPAKTGSLRKIELLRNGKTVSTFDLYDFLLRGDKSADVRLQSGDTIFVPVVGPLVGIAGNVRRPAIYELKGTEDLRRALDLAGGLIPTAYLQKVQVDRVVAYQAKTILDLNLTPGPAGDSAFNLPLRDRDMIRVAPIAQAGGFVRLEGYVVRPGDYQLTPGMRVSDLILPFDNLLPEFFPGMAQVVRLNPPEFRPQVLTIDLQKALAGDPAHNLALQEYDAVKLFSRKEMQELPEVVITGAVLRPGKFRLFDNMTVKDLVAAAGNLRRRAYAGEAEITRFIPSGKETRTERILIDLDKALQGDPVHNRILEVDDHLFVRSIPDFGEKMTVQVQGEVLFPGTYAIYKGEKLSSVLARAGGFTSEAYLRGAHFSRESLKEVQRQRLNQLILEQEQEISRLTAEIAQGALSAEELKAAQTLVESRTTLLAKLKQTPASGRMVLKLDHLAALSGTANDIEMMDGDVLTVPKNPQSVTVLGQVYNPVSLAYTPGKSVGHYLNMVGGTKKDANNAEMFVVRADGTVISAQQGGWGVSWDRDGGRWTVGGFRSMLLYPGDTILVPEKVEKIAWLREIRDISTIVFQLALGAAAIASF